MRRSGTQRPKLLNSDPEGVGEDEDGEFSTQVLKEQAG